MTKPNPANPAFPISDTDLAHAIAQIGAEIDHIPLRSSALARIMTPLGSKGRCAAFPSLQINDDTFVVGAAAAQWTALGPRASLSTADASLALRLNSCCVRLIWQVCARGSSYWTVYLQAV